MSERETCAEVVAKIDRIVASLDKRGALIDEVDAMAVVKEMKLSS